MDNMKMYKMRFLMVKDGPNIYLKNLISKFQASSLEQSSINNFKKTGKNYSPNKPPKTNKSKPSSNQL